MITLLFFLILGCNPYVSSDLYKNRIKKDVYRGLAFGLIEEGALIDGNTVSISDTSFMGTVRSYYDDFTVNCDYLTLVSLLIEQARAMGGNCLQIKEHVKPKYSGDCHQLKGNVYYIDNPREYETYVSWDENRKLEVLDFKGKEKQQLESKSGIICYLRKYESHYDYGKAFTIGVENIFFAKEAYFEKSEKDSFNIVSENIYFDITELHRRELIRKIREELFSYNQLYGQIERVGCELMEDCRKLQLRCESEIMIDSSRQKYWVDWIKKELNKLEPYNLRFIDLPLNPVEEENLDIENRY